MSDPTTPLMQQYHAIKSRYPHALLLFRLGDFYELFYEDALVASKEALSRSGVLTIRTLPSNPPPTLGPSESKGQWPWRDCRLHNTCR